MRVVATGVFDLIHLGHLHFLEHARRLGDELVVVVARDSTARRLKHQPITPESMRVELVGALKPVDRAVLGHEEDIFKIIEELRPGIIALGYDQQFDEEELRLELERRGLDAKIVRLPQLDHDLNGTRKIIKKIVDWNSLQERLRSIEGGEGR